MRKKTRRKTKLGKSLPVEKTKNKNPKEVGGIKNIKKMGEIHKGKKRGKVQRFLWSREKT